MITHETYKKLLGEQTLGRARKSGADMLMDATFKGDIQYMVGYFYDYYHDDEPLIYKGLHPENSVSKIPIEIKFIVHSHNTENKDQVGYHIQFKTTQENPIDYYSDYVKKWDCEFPVGLYVDLPDEKNIYRKWLVTERVDWLGLQFPTWYILPIDYIYQWVYNSKDGRRYKYQMCGVQRSQSSYNSGVWLDLLTLLVQLINLFNCWNCFRACLPQHNDEIRISVMDGKVTGLANQQRNSEQEDVHRLGLCRRDKCSEKGDTRKSKDIVETCMKVQDIIYYRLKDRTSGCKPFRGSLHIITITIF